MPDLLCTTAEDSRDIRYYVAGKRVPRDVYHDHAGTGIDSLSTRKVGNRWHHRACSRG